MRNSVEPERFSPIDASAPIGAATHGGRAKCLQRLIRLDLPVPEAVALSFDAVRRIAAGRMPDIAAILAPFGPEPLLAVRPSSEDPEWGGPGAILNVGMNERCHARLSELIGRESANALYLRFIQAWAINAAGLDPDAFELPVAPTDDALDHALRAYEDESGDAFPQDPEMQLAGAMLSMAQAWECATARLLREARGAPPEAGLGLVVQRMALGHGAPESGSGVARFACPDTGQPQVACRYLSRSGGSEGPRRAKGKSGSKRNPRGASLQDLCAEAYEELARHGAACRAGLREEMQIDFALEAGRLTVLDAVPAPRSARAALRIAVRLAEDGVISREEAVLRIPPRSLTELLHPQVDPRGSRDVFASGIAASPGAAVGRIAFSSAAVQASVAQGADCILVRRETTPEDIRGMHVASGVLTERGGMTSHAAVIARGLGVPCVVGATGIQLDYAKKTLKAKDGRVFREGDIVTIDGAAGEVLVGAAGMQEPALDEAFRTLLSWADARRDIGIRANADTPGDARQARAFDAEGIGLCRTEHMFFERDGLAAMREMIFADSPEDRRAALDLLLPMQREDFAAMFGIMKGLPVCIRLFDPPLHEFLPSDGEGVRELAESLDLPIEGVARRVEALGEFNPMLGMRGVRLGITVPEIYDMQARAIFEATTDVLERGESVVPEIMIPLVSARREVELVKRRIDEVAAAVREEKGRGFDYRLGVMVETPRAALRADEIATQSSFLSFGTNDLTQMTYGLSRDDAGRFMSEYVNLGVFPEDPFHVLDAGGVGELLTIAAERGRRARPDIALAVCGEHGGNAESIAFCRAAGFDYVSCSPFRVPVARLAAAHLALTERSKSWREGSGEAR